MNNRKPKEGRKGLNGAVVFCSLMGGRASCLSLDPRIGGEGVFLEDIFPEQICTYRDRGFVDGEDIYIHNIKKFLVKTCVWNFWHIFFFFSS